MKRIFTLIALTSLIGPAYGGGLVMPASPVLFDAAPSAMDANWTSNYAGAILAYGEISRETALGEDDHSGIAGSFILGHMRDFGNWVGAVELMGGPGLDAEVAGREVKWAVAARAKAGLKFGPDSRWLGFASLGFARGKTERSSGGDSRYANGYLYGVGVNYLLNDEIMVGGEIIRSVKTGEGNADGTGFGISLAYRF